ncbi:MAG: hypothetical protein KDB61_01335 [Planctomycetes bacterium]|nr:hypothetical protein [Planctomycetota bacterium]
MHERLAHWDELSEIDLARVQAFPEARAKLHRLRQAQAWLEDSLLSQQECPTPEELFSLGMPFSGEPLDAERRTEIQEHVKLCSDCAREVQTLTVLPPAPLAMDPIEHQDQAEPGTRRTSPGLRRLQTILAAAAALMLVWLLGARNLFQHPQGVQAAEWDWPELATLRGEPSTILIYPRGKQLAREADGTWQGAFQIRAEPEAQSYRVTVLKNDGSAMDMGEKVTELTGPSNTLALPSPLEPGFYTASIYATVHGLEAPLGRAEFQVRADAETYEKLHALEGVARVRFLHDRGWTSDALIEAQGLPDSPERDTYIRAMESR